MLYFYFIIIKDYNYVFQTVLVVANLRRIVIQILATSHDAVRQRQKQTTMGTLFL